MADAERRARKVPQPTDPKDSDNNGGAKLWTTFPRQRNTTKHWWQPARRGDIDGLLIFRAIRRSTSGPDSGDTSEFLLAQILRQLAATANGTSLPITPHAPFSPVASSLICNTLWFISQQWARDFLHRMEICSAPLVRGRVFSYLYYGLTERYNMHMVVDLIPLLLHASLFFFFAGLVAFLIPVNTVIMALTAGILAIVTAVYCCLTILPLFHLDCPYRTPLSRALWRIIQAATTILRSDATGAASLRMRTPLESMFGKATEYSEERAQRDCNALI
ncbi:hypothetical protein DFH07DRAFT_1030268 [Mycena maculata]|uniref:DUF6535 domain-containing protein n=1 Tax=Mycena maculata TaxID=230809 RepID=A0AAD7K6M8_9AGAR|nr:hypothetical protein DFH07DRAFT_1030268 [Mycena maculata]